MKVGCLSICVDLLGPALTRLPQGVEAITALTASDPQDVYATPAQLDSELMTLTFLPRSKWQTLLNIEVIQVGQLSLYSRGRLTEILPTSNEISQKSLQSLWNRRPSSSLLSPALNTVSIFPSPRKKEKQRKVLSQPGVWCPSRVNSCGSSMRRMLMEIVRKSSEMASPY